MYGPVMCVRTLIIGFIITTAVCDTISGGVSSSAVRVTLPKGEVEGKIKKTWYSLAFHDEPIQFFSFEGIPYAAPPVGDLRFRPPVPAAKWSGIYQAKSPKPKCPQITEIYEEYEGEEDCLYVNVYSRNLNPKTPRPVIVIVYGGRFRAGAGHFLHPPDLLLEMDLVIVTFNYRLSVLGLLSLGTEDVPGNMQLKDTLLALKWVQKNVKYFGGDPDNVTLYGLSSGATTAYLLQMSPLAKGLFHKTILMSGVFLCHWNFGYDPVEVALNFTNYLGYNTSNVDKALYYLMKQPAQRLVRGVLDFENENGVEIFKFGPVLEKTFGRNTAILPRTPYAAYQSGEFSDVPTMISYTTSEFAHYLYTDQILEKFMSRSDSMIPRNWKLRVGSKLFNETISRIKNFYFDSKEINLSKHDDVVKCIQLVSDYKFVTTINEVARVHSNYAKSPLYLYRFAYRGGLNNPNMERLGIQGACHGDDKAYILPKLNKTIPMWSSDNFVRRRHLTIYKNFMENNDPTFGPYTILLPVKWPPFTNDKKKFLHINGDIVVSQDPDERKVKFWEDLEEYIMKEDNVNKDWKLQTCLTK